MGNSLGGKRVVKVMKIDGQTFKLKAPVRVEEVVKDYPGYVMMESDAVKRLGIEAKPLEPQQELKPKKLYFLVEIPKLPSQERAPRKVRSGIQMSAKDRLENLMLSRRCASDLSMLKPTSSIIDRHYEGGSEAGAVRVRMRLPKAQVAKLVEESKDAAEAARKIMELCKAEAGENVNGVRPNGDNEGSPLHQQTHRKPGLGSVAESLKKREKRVSFLPIKEDMGVAVGA